jgi:hypothetical protein
MTYYNWKIEKNDKNKTVRLYLELKLREHSNSEPLAPKIKVNLQQAIAYLRKNGIEVGKVVKNATVVNTSEETRSGSWIFELKALKTQPVKTQKTQQRKKTTSRKKKPPPSGALTDN